MEWIAGGTVSLWPLVLATAGYLGGSLLLDASINFVGFSLATTLGKMLERAEGRIRLNIELKYYGWDPELAPAVMREVRARGMEAGVILMSLEMRALRQLCVLAPDIPAGYVAAAVPGDLARLPVDFLAVADPGGGGGARIPE